jgi:Uncharacterized protein conserved in bacteria (DUF2252)
LANPDFRKERETWQIRHAAGKSLREKVPRESHAGWKPPRNRPNPVSVLLKSNFGRQEEFVPLRMSRMAVPPFGFLHGATAMMAWDLAHTPVTGIHLVIDGDAHVNNFGLYGTPQRDVLFDLNDFDEVTFGPWEFDLKRLVACVATRSCYPSPWLILACKRARDVAQLAGS